MKKFNLTTPKFGGYDHAVTTDKELTPVVIAYDGLAQPGNGWNNVSLKLIGCVSFIDSQYI